MTAMALPQNDWLSRLRTIMVLRPGQRVLHMPGIGVTTSRRAVISSTWPLDWTVPGVTMPTILYQFKGAPDQATMITNLGGGAPNYNGYATGTGQLPSCDVDRGAVFRGVNSTYTLQDAIATGYPAVNTGTFYYYYLNQRLVSDRDGTSNKLQRTGYINNPRTYLAHYFSTPQVLVGSGSTTYTGTWQAAGSLGLSPGKAYKNGVLVHGALSTTWLSHSVMFGAAYSGYGWLAPGNCFCCDVPIFAWWATPISDTEMSLWEAAVVERLEL